MNLKFLFFAFLASCFFAAPSQAQKDSKAKVVLDAMSQKFQSMKGFTASFEYTFQDEGGKKFTTTARPCGPLSKRQDTRR
jgi:outer membrane lipoprotein-sorting protein